ncbi:MAG: hypothetical protein IPM34_11505 [Saprospiraceae bacterium]|nr:hypothetical protein [Saprospiraceae bacterium]
MKKLGLFVCLLFVCSISNAQKVYAWWDAGVKLGYGLTGFLNSNILDDSKYDYKLSTGYSLGGKFGMFFGLYNGFTIEANLASYNQEFEYSRNNTQLIHEINWKNLDLALLYRNQRNGVYVELGPMLSLINKVNQYDPADPEKTDVKKYYEKNYISGVFGVGGYIFNYENFTTMLGIRLGYGFTDMVNDEGKAAGFPNPSSASQPYASEKSTNAAFVQLNLEFNFALGYYGRSSCSKRASLFKM